MKNFTFVKCALISILAISFLNASAQTVPDSVYYKRLYYLCKAWGHAKYYHTEIARGLINWDDELLTAIDGVKNATSNSDYNEVIETMINNAGTMGTSSVMLPDVLDSIYNNKDLNWIYDTIFSDTVSALLDTIMQRFRPQRNVYLDVYLDIFEGDDENVSFEKDTLYYSGPDYPSEGKRLLALFRYWNMIHYFFPHKNIMDQHWDTSLVEFLPKIVKAGDALSYHLSFKEFITRINDSHGQIVSQVFDDWNGYYFPGFRMRFIENETVIASVKEGITNIAVGDIVKEIDGHDIYELRDSLRKYAHGSNEAFREFMLNYYILNGDYGDFQITVDNGIDIHTETLTRKYEQQQWPHDKAIMKLDTTENGCRIGVVDMGLISILQVEEMYNLFWDTDAIIFDIRGYPLMTFHAIVSHLLSSPMHLLNYTTGDIFFPGRFFWREEFFDYNTNIPYSGEVIILFDETTMSQAEFTCMGIELFPGATKIGSTTAGADGDISVIYLPGNITTYATFLGVFYPDYTPTQRVGIIPDIEVTPTILGIKNGIDEVMDYALNLLDCDTTYNNCDTIYTTNSINNVHDAQEIKFYPNPVNYFLKYELPENYQDNNTLLFEIIDIHGRKIKNVIKNKLSDEIDISKLKSGIYIIKIITNKNILTKLIVKN